MNGINEKAISKQLSYVLRHRPDSIGLTLDAEGWANIQELISKLADVEGMIVTLSDLEQVVNNNDKQRFTIKNDKIRANQGHSVPVDLKLTPKIPPVVLYHGTVSKYVGAIMKEGLKPMNRQHVHLSADIATARIVGARRGAPVILIVDTRVMVKTGQKFYLSDNGVWLTEHVPPSAITQK